MSRWEPMLERVMQERAPRLLAYAYLLTGSEAEAADAVQDALVRTFSRGRSFDSLAQAEAYTRRAIASVVVDRARSGRARKGRERVGAPREVVPDRDHDAAIDVRAALGRLGGRERACVVLRFYDDLTVPQIAGRLGLAEGTVKRYLSDANTKLAGLLGDAMEEEHDTVPVTAQGERTP